MFSLVTVPSSYWPFSLFQEGQIVKIKIKTEDSRLYCVLCINVLNLCIETVYGFIQLKSEISSVYIISVDASLLDADG